SGLPAASTHLEVGDFNGDHDPDLLILGGDQSVYLVLGSASGLGASSTRVVSPEEIAGQVGPIGTISSFVVNGMAAGGDFDGDGKDDFLVYGTEIDGSGERYLVLPMLSSMRFNVFTTYGVFASGVVSPSLGLPALSDHAVAIGDLNNDHAPDLFMNFGFAHP